MNDVTRQICIDGRQNWRGVSQLSRFMTAWEGDTEAVATVDADTYECFSYHPSPLSDVIENEAKLLGAICHQPPEPAANRIKLPPSATSPAVPRCKGHPEDLPGDRYCDYPAKTEGYCGRHYNVLKRQRDAERKVAEIAAAEPLVAFQPFGYYVETCTWCGAVAPFHVEGSGLSASACAGHANASYLAGYEVTNNRYDEEAFLDHLPALKVPRKR